jgi:hypothetical protein
MQSILMVTSIDWGRDREREREREIAGFLFSADDKEERFRYIRNEISAS